MVPRAPESESENGLDKDKERPERVDCIPGCGPEREIVRKSGPGAMWNCYLKSNSKDFWPVAKLTANHLKFIEIRWVLPGMVFGMVIVMYPSNPYHTQGGVCP